MKDIKAKSCMAPGLESYAVYYREDKIYLQNN